MRSFIAAPIFFFIAIGAIQMRVCNISFSINRSINRLRAFISG